MKPREETLSQAEARELLNYDPVTGVFTWKRKVNNNGTGSGVEAGHTSPAGYRVIKIRKAKYFAHRLAWLLTHGGFPSGFVDHIDGDPLNNRIDNLRVVTQTENAWNTHHARKDNTTGALGVSRAKGRFQARISVNGRQIFLGAFDSVEVAHQAYLEKKRELHSTCTI